MKLDLYDKKILYALDCNARASASEIGKKINLSKGTVNYRIKRLMDNSFITRFYTIINSSLLGYYYYKINMKFQKLTSEVEQEIIDFIQKEPSCSALRITEGQYNLVFFTLHKNPADLKRFMQKFSNLFGNYLLEKDVNTIVKSHRFNQKFLIDGNSMKFSSSHEELGGYVADITDVKILQLIATNARMKLNDIAQKIHKDSKLIKYRMKRMQDRGVIVAYTSALNLPLLQRELVQLDISLKSPASINSVIEFFDRTNSCLFAYEQLGKYDLSVELYIKNDDQIKDILNEFREKFIDAYIQYNVSHIYREYVINLSPFKPYDDVRRPAESAAREGRQPTGATA